MGLKFDPTYYANIAGNIASIQLPLIAALGMKNNIISCGSFCVRCTQSQDTHKYESDLTGVGFDKVGRLLFAELKSGTDDLERKLLYLHSMVSRVLVVLIWLHAGGRVCLLPSPTEHLLKGSTSTDTYRVSTDVELEESLALRYSSSLSGLKVQSTYMYQQFKLGFWPG